MSRLRLTILSRRARNFSPSTPSLSRENDSSFRGIFFGPLYFMSPNFGFRNWKTVNPTVQNPVHTVQKCVGTVDFTLFAPGFLPVSAGQLSICPDKKIMDARRTVVHCS